MGTCEDNREDPNPPPEKPPSDTERIEKLEKQLAQLHKQLTDPKQAALTAALIVIAGRVINLICSHLYDIYHYFFP